MNFITTINPKENPNEVGELLRAKFFNQKTKCSGCVSTFELNSEVKVLPDEVDFSEDPNYTVTYKCAELNIEGSIIEMRYTWDEGDGELTFSFPDGSSVCNFDCKKNNRWEYLP